MLVSCLAVYTRLCLLYALCACHLPACVSACTYMCACVSVFLHNRQFAVVCLAWVGMNIFMRDKATYKRVNDMETVARLLKTTKSNVCLYTSFIVNQIVKCNTVICIHHKYIIYTQWKQLWPSLYTQLTKYQQRWGTTEHISHKVSKPTQPEIKQTLV